MSTPTTNYGFAKPDFNSRPWDGVVNGNYDLLDTILYTITQIPNIGGAWRNSTSYTAGQNILDPVSLVFYQCLVNHVSAATGLFSADRAANPTYWTVTNAGQGSIRYDQGQVLTSGQVAQAWTNLNLLTTFLRFDTAQTLTYNQMLQVLNTLGIDGTVSTLASAATTDISGANTQCVDVTGAVTITSFGARPNKYKMIRFLGSLTLTNSSALVLPGNANVVTQPGDMCVATSDGSTPTANWTVRSYQRADGTLVIGKPLLVSSVQTLSATEQANGRQALNAAYAEDLKSALVEIAKLRGSAYGTPNYLADSFVDSSGIDITNAVNANVQGGTVSNQALDPNTKGLLHFDGTSGSTSFPDAASGHTVTASGNAQISTAQSAFGGASLRIGASGDYVTYTSTSDFGVGTGDFTVNIRVRLDSNSGSPTIVDCAAFQVYLPSGSGQVRFFDRVGAATIATGTTVILANTWYDIEITRASGTVRVFVNGNLDASGACASNFGTALAVRIGADITGATPGVGYFDEFRFSNIARHTAAFTPAASAFSAGTSGVLTLPSINTPITAAAKASMYAMVKQTAGTLTINTNMIFSVSRDGGTTYTPFVLSNVGSYGGYTVYEQISLDISAQPAASNIRYKAITNDVALGVAIDAVLLQWG